MEDIDIRSWGSPDGRIISGKPQRPSHGVKLASIDGIGAGIADQTGCHVLDTPFFSYGADGDNTGGSTSGIAVSAVAGVCFHSLCSCPGNYIGRTTADISGVAQCRFYIASEDLRIWQITVFIGCIDFIIIADDLDIGKVLAFIVFGDHLILGTGHGDSGHISCISGSCRIGITAHHITVAGDHNVFQFFRCCRTTLGHGCFFYFIAVAYNTIAVPFHTVFIPKDSRIRSTYISSCTCCSRAVLAAQDIGICPSNPVLSANCPRRNTGCLCVCSYSQRVSCQCLSRISHSGSTFTVTFGITADGDGLVVGYTGRITNGNRFIYTASTIFYRRRRKSPYSQWVISGCLSASPDCRVILITADG